MTTTKRKLRMGMIGGSSGSFIGDVHRKAAQFEGEIELVAGAFSRDAARSRAMADKFYLDPARCYDSYEEMARAEKASADGVDFVSIVTPNNSHFPIAKTFLDAGIHVVCDKPVTFSFDEAVRLRAVIQQSGKRFAITYGYTGYPMVKLARDMVRQGLLGEIVKIQAQYPQGWLMEAEEAGQQSLNSWRTDPQINGKGGAVGDIGTHAANLAEYISGLRIQSVCAQLKSHNPARPLDDDANCLVQYSNGAVGILWASQISIGELNALAIKVFGRQGSIEWRQEYPTDLYHYTPDGVIHTYRRGTVAVGKISPAAAAATRLPFGHPEALYESFATIYKNFGGAVRADLEGRAPTPIELDYPSIDDGISGMAFIDAVVDSKGAWKEVAGQ